MIPIRLSIITLNLWNTERWPLRQPALERFVEVFRPDILCLQELSIETQLVLDRTTPDCCRIHDEFAGWTSASNIYWNRNLFKEIEHGVEDIGVGEDRGLFWVRLELREVERTLLVSTAHFTYKAHPRELETGLSPRLEQARRTARALDTLARNNEPTFFMGDLNDTSHPVFILHEAGYLSCFAALGVPTPTTAPCYPTANIPMGDPTLDQTLDWVFSNKYARVVAAEVPHFYLGDIAPSDHWPVLVVYEI